MPYTEEEGEVPVVSGESQVPPILKGCIKKLDAEKSTSFKSKYKYFVLILTFFIYASYHLTRKPISVVKSVMNPCDGVNMTNCTGGWAPFNGTSSKAYLGVLDSTYLFAYALGMFVCGHVAERSNLRNFLFFGMVLSGATTALFGCAKYWDLHSIYFYAVLQAFAGLFQATGWPPVVACVANWFGKGSRGFVMGVWNSHTSVGNILGSILAGAFVDSDWALSFIIPGLEIIVLAAVVLLFLIPDPADIDNMTGYKTLQNTEERDEEILAGNGNTQSGETEVILELPTGEVKAISFWRALMIPGVIEFSLCLFFSKLVSYTFLFWLPYYISQSSHFDASTSALLSTLFDVGGILGGVAAGGAADLTGAGALTCMTMLLVAAPLMFLYYFFGHVSLAINIILLTLVGFFVNGPYSLITTAISADLGTHPCLKGNSKALSTVTAIIDGTGSIGAAIGPLLTSLLSQHGWDRVFVMLISSDVLALLVSSYIHFSSRTGGTPPRPLRSKFSSCFSFNPYRVRLGLRGWMVLLCLSLMCFFFYVYLTSDPRLTLLKI